MNADSKKAFGLFIEGNKRRAQVLVRDFIDTFHSAFHPQNSIQGIEQANVV